MKINLENMKELAERLDSNKLIADYAEDDVMNMAYQLQYFFEAMEKINYEVGRWAKLNVRTENGLREALSILNNALVDKPEEK